MNRTNKGIGGTKPTDALLYGGVKHKEKLFPAFLVLGVARCCFVLKNPLADNPLWVKIWVRAFFAEFAEI